MKLLCKILVVIFLFGCALEATGQQIPIFSLYNQNGYVLNPGITGAEGHGIFSASYRHQWSNMKGGPKTISGGYRMPIYQKGDYFQKARNFIGVGAYAVHDETGPTTYTQATLSYAYHISFAKINPFSWARFLRKSHISIGIAASFYQYRLNSTELLPEMANDQLILAGDKPSILPNAGVGIYYYYDKFFLGFSAPQLIPLKARFNDDGLSTSIKKVNHYFLVVGGKVPLGPDVPRDHYHLFYLEPMAWFKYVNGAPYQYDIYLKLRFRNSVWIGTGYRSSKTIVMDAGFLIKEQLQLGYAYDLSITDFNSSLGNTHEIILSYHLDFGKGRPKRY